MRRDDHDAHGRVNFYHDRRLRPACHAAATWAVPIRPTRRHAAAPRAGLRKAPATAPAAASMQTRRSLAAQPARLWNPRGRAARAKNVGGSQSRSRGGLRVAGLSQPHPSATYGLLPASPPFLLAFLRSSYSPMPATAHVPLMNLMPEACGSCTKSGDPSATPAPRPGDRLEVSAFRARKVPVRACGGGTQGRPVPAPDVHMYRSTSPPRRGGAGARLCGR